MKRRHVLAFAGGMLAAVLTSSAAAQTAAWQQAAKSKHGGTEIRAFVVLRHGHRRITHSVAEDQVRNFPSRQTFFDQQPGARFAEFALDQ